MKWETLRNLGTFIPDCSVRLCDRSRRTRTVTRTTQAGRGLRSCRVKGRIRDHGRHVSHLKWLKEKLGDRLLDAVVVNTGSDAYRRKDGIGVVPLSLLGP